MSLVYKGLSVSCFNRQLQPQVTQHGPPGRDPPNPPSPSSALGRDRCSGSAVRWWQWGLKGEGGGLLPPGCGRSVSAIERKPVRSGKPRRHESAAICGATARILVAFDTLLPSGKNIRAPFKSGDRGGRVFREHGWYFLRLDIEKKITVHAQRRVVKCETQEGAPQTSTQGGGGGFA